MGGKKKQEKREKQEKQEKQKKQKGKLKKQDKLKKQEKAEKEKSRKKNADRERPAMADGIYTKMKSHREDAPDSVRAAAGLFRALGDENRLRILALLRDGEMCAGDLLKSLSIVQSTLSHHMKILVESGVVQCRRQGKWSYYSVGQTTMREIDGLMERLTPQEQAGS